MLKNHFIFSYAGNKRNEIIQFMDYIDFNNKKNIIECFCGSSTISFHIWKKYGNQFNYHLNDLDNKLIDVYFLLRDKSIEEIEDNINIIKNKFLSYENDKERKEYFNNEIVKSNNIYNYIFNKKYSTFRAGLCPSLKRIPKSDFKISAECQQFIEFIKSPNVYIYGDDWKNIFNKFKDQNDAIIILDPPYMFSCNRNYEKQDCSVYEYFFNNSISYNDANIYFILEDIWIIRLLFQNQKILLQYDKKYELRTKKTTKHIIISNK